MKGKGKGLLAILGTPEDDEEPKSGRMPADEEDDDEGEAEDAAQALIDAVEAKDAAGVVEAFSRLKASC